MESLHNRFRPFPGKSWGHTAPAACRCRPCAAGPWGCRRREPARMHSSKAMPGKHRRRGGTCGGGTGALSWLLRVADWKVEKGKWRMQIGICGQRNRRFGRLVFSALHFAFSIFHFSIYIMTLLLPKHLTLYDLVHQRPEAVVLRLHSGN